MREKRVTLFLSRLIASQYLIYQADLGVLQFSRLGVKSFLPSKLSQEAISQPHNQKVQIIFSFSTFFKQVSNFEVSMHERPRIILLALDNVSKEIIDGQIFNQNDLVVASLVIEPDVFSRQVKNKVESL